MALLRILWLCLLLPGILWARERPDEYAVKAVYLYKIALFVRWPDEAFADSSQPLVIGVVGHDPFGPTLDRTLTDKTLSGRRLELQRYATAADVEACHILFLGDQDPVKAWSTGRSVRGQATLTVGESEQFIDAGGTLSFIIRNNQVRFRISGERARLAGLNISSKLLQLSE
ncbi:MAG: YfiR family protein [bacterium]|nr:YfiR family protein [bacterium]